MTKVAEAEASIKSLEDKRQHLIQQAVELASERDRVAFDAHSGNDPKARKRLDAINIATATHTSEMSSIESAINVANARLVAARADESRAADRAQALQLREKLKRFSELGSIIDDCFADMNSAAAEMKDTLVQMHQLGATAPSHDQMRVLGALALKTALMGTPWSKEGFEYLAPNQRRSFRDLVSGWERMLTPHIDARIGDSKREAA